MRRDTHGDDLAGHLRAALAVPGPHDDRMRFRVTQPGATDPDALKGALAVRYGLIRLADHEAGADSGRSR